MELFDKNIESIGIEEEIKGSYLDYAMSVIIGRALPDVRDGLKPVHRRILFAMRDLGNDYNKPYKKSARVVGDVIGKYHPHGDQAVYDAVARMAQDFSMRYVLVDGQGNFGSIDGDPPAAMRYTEVRMAKLAQEYLADIDKDTVDFTVNYDGSLQEPTVLPAKAPSLLINGSSGIAVGMATNIPPHNLSEVVDGLIAMIHKPDITPQELMQYIPGPDFPSAGFVINREGILEAYRKGKGIIKLRGRVNIETRQRDNRKSIVITEIPYQVNKSRLLENIGELVRDKKIEGISELRDESDREGLRVVMEVKRDYPPEIIVNHLYRHTQLETSFGINLLAIVNQAPRVLTLKELLEYFLEHRREVIVRRTRYELAKAEAQAGVDYLDLNIGPARKAGDEMMAWTVETVRAVTETPLSLDTTNLTAMETGLKAAQGKALVNSIAPARAEAGLKMVKQYDADMIGLLWGIDGMPRDANERAMIAVDLIYQANEMGIPNERIWIDPIASPVSVEINQVTACVEFMAMLEEIAPGCKSTVGLSNISNGTPNNLRPYLNRTYLIMLMRYGLYSAIVDAFDSELIQIARGARPEIIDLVHRTMDGDNTEASSLDEEALNYVKTVRVLTGQSLYSHSWLEI